MEQHVAFLGPHGTFSEAAARHLMADQKVELIPYPTIPHVLDAVHQGQAAHAVVPLENSIGGAVTLTMDWLIHQVDLTILAELTLPISQQLLGVSGRGLHEIKRVYSHPQAIEQCRSFLQKRLPHVEIIYTDSTAEAVRHVMSQPEEPWAAIGTRLAQSIYKCEWLHRDIQDHDHNETRFVLVGKPAAVPIPLRKAAKAKSTFVVTLPADYPGALHQVLSAFAARRLNLTRIESSPTKKGLGSYFFILDVERPSEDAVMDEALSELEALGCGVQGLGTYPVYLYETKGE